MSQYWDRYVRPGLNQLNFNMPSFGVKATGSLLWKRVTFLVATPIVGLCMINAYRSIDEEKKDIASQQPFVKYEYMRRRNKRFPWGNGDRSLFHNPNTNALADGYEL
ncbi:LOW QUALITY PROTEIN: cytochrome c oxidase subunit 6A, mitochondrial [Drosophila nasuta]|uniref:Cytochrome c oxidase subunit 6A, mitochondrial n=1 Tax=Drosophila albomicans TaxID=7291 RepID=A0A6P8X9M3_DROAB|nr:cytochrome c oxidase subunit 6A, mitochondrial [Drosophila albomicans]XP_060657296.1 LOW QUALITY PROTEIN: cytochrome c oxidase subunit 6A, mitochondrial [Drosophila nasuta]